MKKFLIWATAATLMTGAAFAQNLNSQRFAIAPNATFAAGAPATTNNDDSCDIAVTPAATLLLPYFEVDFASPSTDAVNTIFTLTNTTNMPQIAHITVWTDWSFPVLDFNVFLTGYDVQGISLYDIIARGVIPSTSITTTRGPRSLNNTSGNPNFAGNVATACANLPGPINAPLLAAVQSALTTGVYTLSCPANVPVGGEHDNAVGYVTVDVANTCSQSLPIESSYYSTEILFDNALIGDYQRINPLSTTGNYAGGESLVHIRAIPEGGAAGTTPGTNLPFTFYDRYTPALTPDIDRRQPLPGLFAARFIQGGTGSFNTTFSIWREGFTGSADEDPGDTCDDYVDNGFLPYTEIVRFDEHENPTTITPECRISPCQIVEGTLPETSNNSVDTAGLFPPDYDATSDAGGWMYLNLNQGQSSPAFGTARTTGQTQNWVTVKMTAEGRYGVDFDAAYLGNGCSPNPGITVTGTTGTPVVGPAPNVTPALP
jgi:hypothetical protein